MGSGRARRLRGFDKQLGAIALAPFNHDALATPPLFHYTSCDALRMILTTQEMAATIHHDLEPKELRVAHPLVVRKVDEIYATASPLRKRAIEAFRTLYYSRQVADHVTLYLTCFTTARDSSDLWKSFGAEVCMGFKLFPGENPPREYLGTLLDRLFLRVNYDADELERRIHIGFHGVLERYERFVALRRALHRHDGTETLRVVALNLVLVAAYAGITSKDPEQFQKENEWRWVSAQHDPDDAPMKGIKKSPSGKRYITLRMREKPRRLELSEIIARDAGVAATVEKVLDEAGYTGESRPPVVLSGA